MKLIVTGASKGIGKGIALHLADKGCAVGLLARSHNLLADLRDRIRSDGRHCAAVPCDLRDPHATARAIDALAAELGGLDALVNNAGAVIRKSALDLSLDEWQFMLETNVSGVFYATRAVLPRFIQQGRGHIVNISSISGKVPLLNGSGYAATKFAVTGFSHSLFQEVRDYGIKVTTIYPGSVNSESHRHDPAADHSWKVTPDDIGAAVYSALATPPGTLISEIEVRPLRKGP